LRFNEVTGSNISPNSVSYENLQDWSVGTENLQSHSVTKGKIGNWAINKEQIAPGAVTSSGLAIDIVKLVVSDTFTLVSEDQRYPMPRGVESILPVENFLFGEVFVDNPDSSLSYRVNAKARGPGVILGWYPSKNGHLLRYQAGRALRGLTCVDVGIEYIILTHGCSCNTDLVDFFDFDTTGNDADCECFVSYTYDSTVWSYSGVDDGGVRQSFAGFGNHQDDIGGADLGTNTATTDVVFCGVIADQLNLCTSLAGCLDADVFQDDPQCDRRSPGDTYPDPNQPDRCSSFTSVEDVNNPQEGVPTYSPSVESITIDEEGIVEMRFFGRGSWLQAVEDIEISVVVLLDEQYGA